MAEAKQQLERWNFWDFSKVHVLYYFLLVS